MKVYLSGTIVNDYFDSAHKFGCAEGVLKSGRLKHLFDEVINKFEITYPETCDGKYTEYIKKSISYLLDCDLVIVVDKRYKSGKYKKKGWDRSLELRIAKTLKIPIKYIDEYEDMYWKQVLEDYRNKSFKELNDKNTSKD